MRNGLACNFHFTSVFRQEQAPTCADEKVSGSLKPWIVTIAKHRARDYKKNGRRTIDDRHHHITRLDDPIFDDNPATLADQLPDTRPLADEHVFQHEIQTHLLDAVKDLPEEQREPMRLFFAREFG